MLPAKYLRRASVCYQCVCEATQVKNGSWRSDPPVRVDQWTEADAAFAFGVATTRMSLGWRPPALLHINLTLQTIPTANRLKGGVGAYIYHNRFASSLSSSPSASK